MAYSYNHDCPFEAFITNLGKYNEGELVGEWVKFPTTPEELQKVFERIGIGSQNEYGSVYEEWFITDYDCYVDGLYEKLGEYENLDELNYLASKLEELSDAEYEQFQAAMEISDYTSSLKDLINLTDNLDKYELIPGIEDYADLGRLFVDEYGSLEVPEHLKNYIDYEAYGRDIALDEVGSFTDQGYVRDTYDRFTEYYDGDRENIPEEYRVMSSPEEPEELGSDSERLDASVELALDTDTYLRQVSSIYCQLYPKIQEQREKIADRFLENDYGDLKQWLIAAANHRNAKAPEAKNLLNRIQVFEDTFIGKDERKENYLKNAEMAVEDDYGMIDGIINNGERAADREVQTDKPSVLGQLSQAKKECAERKPPEPGKLGKEEPEL